MENIVTKIKNVKMNSTGSQFHFTVNTGHINNRNINDSYSIKLDKSGSEINYRGK
jgi:hypothetical protein